MGIFKKIFRPIRKVLDKVVPNEIKPFLPYASAALPFLMPAAASGSFLNSMMGRALLTGGANIGSQLAQEGADDDINWLSAALAGTTGALSAPGASDYLTGLTTKGGLADMGIIGSDARTALANRNFLTKASDFGLTSLAKGADFISGAGKTLRNPKMNMETVKAAADTLSKVADKHGGSGWIMHHVLDSRELGLEPFGVIHLPQLHLFGLDISITKHIVFMWLAAIIVFLVLSFVARAYKKSLIPKGFTNFIEILIVFVRDEIAKPTIGEGYQKFLPFLLSTFFFILTMNFLGLLPYGNTATSNIAITSTLAIFSFRSSLIDKVAHC